VQSKPWHIIVASGTLALGSSLASVGCRETPTGPQTGVETVRVAPPAARVVVSDTLRFSALVTGPNPNHAVRWLAAWGTIDSSGLYLAPARPGADTVQAVSVVDSTKTGRSPVVIITGIDAVTIAPISPTIVTGDSLRFAATVTGVNANRTVRWSASRGTIDGSGLYLAPASPGADTVQAVSVVDSTRLATVLLTITNQPLLLWTTHFPASSLPGSGYLWGVVLDQDENVIAAGTTYNNSITGTQRAVVLSTDRSGRQRWTYVSEGAAEARDVVLAPDLRSVFVVGIMGDYPQNVPLLFSVSGAGNKQLERVCSSMVGGAFVGATRDDSRVSIAAYTPGPAIVTSDLAGNLNCANPMDAAVGDLARPRLSAASRLAGALVVAGDRWMSNQCWSSGIYPFVQEVSTSSQPVWRFDFGSTIGPTATAGSTPRLAVADEAGQTVIYVVASRIEGCVSTSDFARYMTAKLDSHGNIQWLRLWNGDNSPSSCEAYPYAVIPDPRGGVVVAGMGSTDCLTAWDCAVASYSADGSLRWSMRPVFRGNRNNACSAATMTHSGRYLYVVGQTGVTFSSAQDLFIAKYALPQ